MDEKTPVIKKNPFHFHWLIPVLVKPNTTIAEIVAQEKPVWLTPLAILSTLTIVLALVAAPIKRNIIQMGLNTPPDFQYYSPDQQAQFMNAQATQTSPLFLYVFPILIGLASIWLSWFILSSLLHLSLTLSGSRAASIRSFNLSAWSFLPIGIRLIVQMLALLFTKSVISAQGLSGFMPADATGFINYIGALLGLIDLYFLWQIFLLLIGVLPLSGLTRTKAFTATAVSLLILVLLQAIPGFISTALSGLSVTRPFFF
jgi:hypothetical protein